MPPGFPGGGVGGSLGVESLRFPLMLSCVMVILMLTVAELREPCTVKVQAGEVAFVGPVAALTETEADGAGPAIVAEPEFAGEPFTPMVAPAAQLQFRV